MTVRHVPSKQGAGRGQTSAAHSLPEREVCNCISCGKIYFTRSDTADTLLFLGADNISFVSDSSGLNVCLLNAFLFTFRSSALLSLQAFSKTNSKVAVYLSNFSSLF